MLANESLADTALWSMESSTPLNSWDLMFRLTLLPLTYIDAEPGQTLSDKAQQLWRCDASKQTLSSFDQPGTFPVKVRTVPSTTNLQGQFPPYPNSSTLFHIDCHIRVLHREFKVVQKWHIQTASFPETSQQFKSGASLRLHQTVDTAIRDGVDSTIEVNNRGACHRAHWDAPVEEERKVVWSRYAILFK